MLTVVNNNGTVGKWVLREEPTPIVQYPNTRVINNVSVKQSVDGTYSIDTHRLKPVKELQLQFLAA